ncbi:MAG: hypothetical protein HY202_04705 [Nitrospirae bacterium]|nr:hypothetical protein [Nitrospirota bacterium]
MFTNQSNKELVRQKLKEDYRTRGGQKDLFWLCEELLEWEDKGIIALPEEVKKNASGVSRQGDKKAIMYPIFEFWRELLKEIGFQAYGFYVSFQPMPEPVVSETGKKQRHIRRLEILNDIEEHVRESGEFISCEEMAEYLLTWQRGEWITISDELQKEVEHCQRLDLDYSKKVVGLFDKIVGYYNFSSYRMGMLIMERYPDLTKKIREDLEKESNRKAIKNIPNGG